MNGTELTRRILADLAAPVRRLWRNETAGVWAGRLVARAGSVPQSVTLQPGDIVLRGARHFKAGLCTGSSDLIGIQAGRFVAIEVKGDGDRERPEQRKFIQIVRDLGGIAGFARSVEDARGLLCDS